MSNCMIFFQRDIEILPQLLFAFRTYIDSIYGKGSRDKDTISFITNGVWYSIKSCLKCIGKVRKIAMHFGGFETAKVILFVFPFRVIMTIA